MPATMTEVAKSVGVSVTLVSRLMRNDPTLRISDGRRAQILAEAKRRGGVQVRRSRRTPRSTQVEKRTGTILVPANRLFDRHDYMSEFVRSDAMRSLEQSLSVEDYHVHLSFFDQGEEFEYIRSVIQSGNRCDGLVLGSGLIDARLVELLTRTRFPHVTSSSEAETLRVNMVRGHTADGFRQIVSHLTKLGHRKITYVGPDRSYRYPLFVAAMASLQQDISLADCCTTVELLPGAPPSGERAAAEKAFMQWWPAHRDHGFTALVCSNDRMAFGVLAAMKQLGLKAPEDLSVVGYDNSEQHGADKMDHPILTTVGNPFKRIGQRMGELLLNQILQNQTEIVHERIPADMIIRQTSGPALHGSQSQ